MNRTNVNYLTKWLLLLLSCLSAVAQVGGSVSFSGTLVGGPRSLPVIVCDTWEDFEFSGSVTAASLAAHDHNADANLWSVTDASSKLSTSSSGEKATISAPQGTADTGTLGLAIDCSAGAFAFAYATNALTDTISAGMWFFTTQITTDGRSLNIMQFTDASGTTASDVYFTRASGVSLIRLVSGGNHDITPITTGVWVWVTTKYAKSGTCSLSVYDASGSLVGSTTGTDASGLQVARTYVGQVNQHSADPVTLYYDDVCIDLSAGFPVGP